MLIRSFTHPELLVSEDGDVYMADTMKKLNLIRDHGYSTRGYIVVFKNNKKHKNISLLSLVYETHVKGSKISSNEFIKPIDGDEFNPKASNLISAPYREIRKKIKRDSLSDNSYSTWMNGHDEVYV